MISIPRPMQRGLLGLLLLQIIGSTAVAASWKTDPGLPDSLWVPSVDWRGDTLFALDVCTATDDSLAVAQIVLTWSNPALRLDSVKLNAGRWAVPGYSRWTRAGLNTAVALAFLPTQRRLPPGSGVVARLFFGRDSAYTFEEDAAADTTRIYPQPPLAEYRTVFTDLPDDPFLPSSVKIGTVVYRPCICTFHGDIVDDGEPNSLDLAKLIDGIFAGGAMPLKDYDCPHIHRGDYNCDNFYDAIDLSYLVDYLFAGGPGPCDPCTDL